MKFGDCAELRKENVNPQLIDSNTIYLGLEHISQNSLQLIGMGVATDATSTKQRFISGDIIFGKLRPYFRKVIKPNFSGVCSTDFWVIKPKNGIDSAFLKYWCASLDFINYVNAASEGTRMPRAKWDVAQKHQILDFDIKQQKIIGNILGTLDDKIELNQKMNQTLEDIAKAIFKSWFIDFDPVGAKVQGIPTGLPDEISNLFPNEFVDSELGEIPKGWSVISVGDITNKEITKVKNHEDEVKVLSAVSSGNLELSEDYFTKQVFSKNIDNYYVVPKFAFAYNPSRINIGSIGMNLFKFDGAVSPVYSVFSLKRSLKWYFQQWLNLDSSKNLIASLCSGSVRQSLKHSDFESIHVIAPPENLISIFNEIYELFFESKEIRIHESNTLINIRDTLLPKLISGELKIPDAEKFLEDVGI